MLKKYLVLIFCLLPLLAFSQQADRKLENKLVEVINGFNGDIGIFVKNLRTGKTVAINADTVFPTASVVKVSILLGMMDKIVKKQYTLDSTITYWYKDSLLYPGEDILGEFKDGGQIRINKLIMLMLTTSDNTASLWLQKQAGTGTRINEILDSLGYKSTRVNSRTPGREANRLQYGWGQTTPREIASIFERLYNRNVYSPAASEKMLRMLGRNYWDENAISEIPPTIQVFCKNGAVDQTRNEIMLVNAPNNPYILSIFTKNNKDKSWRDDNEAWVLTRKVSAILWQYFEPKSHWQKPVKDF